MRLVLTGGGTGGHIYPALSIANAFKEAYPDSTIMYIGTSNGLEKEIVGKADLPFQAIEIQGFRRSLFSTYNIKTIMKFIHGVRESKKMLRAFGPDYVVGTGGYVCGPVIYAAAKLGMRTAIHEQNVIPGLTNRFLSKYVDFVGTSFPDGENHFPKAKKVCFTGNPRASDVVTADRTKGFDSLGLDSDRPLVVIVGGSRGAKAINEATIAMFSKLAELSDVNFVYITGDIYYQSAREVILKQLSHIPQNIKMVPYVDNMPELLAATTLIVNRSGATFSAEFTALGIPSILIPSPNVVNNHQEANARWLEREGAAEVLLETELTGDTLYERIDRIIQDPIRLEHMANQAKKVGTPKAAMRFVKELELLN